MAENFRIYTKGGDKGETSLLGGTRVPKSHERVEAYGNLDELNSFTGLLRDQSIDEHSRNILLLIQENLFIAEALIARDPDKPNPALPVIKEEVILLLEKEIDRMNENLPAIRHFILPGGHPAVSFCHVARTVCRRAERSLIRLNQTGPVDEIIISFLNRLSDYFFVLSRKIAHDLKVTETAWPRKEENGEK
ncbi:MAG TPA: cob(I)yrinic acid a,c-diamide adenosyltransferase [Bacteroidales bacterium]|jgi:cob(I)alamin adenosyltransferase|nr:cob(I)yrinic acid a,c-diamide adenosyltransferase [Bacteroidales bacterium]HPT10245.1 cob(I)yrinic acid a,c-diamide adenosyltransferase [Bacteroidales bacterium]